MKSLSLSLLLVACVVGLTVAQYAYNYYPQQSSGGLGSGGQYPAQMNQQYYNYNNNGYGYQNGNSGYHGYNQQDDNEKKDDDDEEEEEFEPPEYEEPEPWVDLMDIFGILFIAFFIAPNLSVPQMNFINLSNALE